MDTNPGHPGQYHTHPVHQLATSQAFAAQPYHKQFPPQTASSQAPSSSTYDSTIPAATETNGATPTGPGRTNAIIVEEANGKRRRTKADEFRLEVEERTRNGESCEQISAALNARGVQVTDKTISRWRITWGLRKRVGIFQLSPPLCRDTLVQKKKLTAIEDRPPGSRPSPPSPTICASTTRSDSSAARSRSHACRSKASRPRRLPPSWPAAA